MLRWKQPNLVEWFLPGSTPCPRISLLSLSDTLLQKKGEKRYHHPCTTLLTCVYTHLICITPTQMYRCHPLSLDPRMKREKKSLSLPRDKYFISGGWQWEHAFPSRSRGLFSCSRSFRASWRFQEDLCRLLFSLFQHSNITFNNFTGWPVMVMHACNPGTGGSW